LGKLSTFSAKGEEKRECKNFQELGPVLDLKDFWEKPIVRKPVSIVSKSSRFRGVFEFGGKWKETCILVIFMIKKKLKKIIKNEKIKKIKKIEKIEKIEEIKKFENN